MNTITILNVFFCGWIINVDFDIPNRKFYSRVQISLDYSVPRNKQTNKKKKKTQKKTKTKTKTKQTNKKKPLHISIATIIEPCNQHTLQI